MSGLICAKRKSPGRARSNIGVIQLGTVSGLWAGLEEADMVVRFEQRSGMQELWMRAG